MNNIIYIYQHAVKCDDQKNIKDITDAAMVYTPKRVTYNITNSPITSTPVKKPRARKSLCLFINILNFRQKTAKRRIVAAKSKRRAIKVGNVMCTNKTKQKRHSKINEQIKRNLYTWITLHPHVFQFRISNYCLKVMLYDKTEPQLVPKLLPQVSIRELNNSLVSDPNDGGIKDDRDEYGTIIISDYTLR